MYYLGYLLIVIVIVILSNISKPNIKGWIGERQVTSKLRKLDRSKYKVINNFLLENNGRTTQIDHIIVSVYGIFIIETKNYRGMIIGNENDIYWTQIFYRRKFSFYSPIKQNNGHIYALKTFLKNFGSIKFNPIIVFNDRCLIRVNTKSPVIYIRDLIITINSYRDEVLLEEDVEKIYSFLYAFNLSDNQKVQDAHIKNIRNRVNTKIK